MLKTLGSVRLHRRPSLVMPAGDGASLVALTKTLKGHGADGIGVCGFRDRGDGGFR